MHVPKSYWGEVVLTAAYLINRLPTRVLGKHSPIELLTKPSSIFPIPLRVFGCVCFVHNHSSARQKLNPRSVKCVFVGYSLTQKGDKCYHPSTRRWYVSMDVSFDETLPYFPPPQSPLRGGGIRNQAE